MKKEKQSMHEGEGVGINSTVVGKKSVVAVKAKFKATAQNVCI